MNRPSDSLYINPASINFCRTLCILPLVEYQILRKLVLQSDVSSFSDVVVLMDMPGQRLPSSLQSLLLEYIRSVVREENGNIQFIIVTSSPALIDEATSEERFMLMPSSEHLIEGSDTNMFLTH